MLVCHLWSLFNLPTIVVNATQSFTIDAILFKSSTQSHTTTVISITDVVEMFGHGVAVGLPVGYTSDILVLQK